jgi:hypothetical protein
VPRPTDSQPPATRRLLAWRTDPVALPNSRNPRSGGTWRRLGQLVGSRWGAAGQLLGSGDGYLVEA